MHEYPANRPPHAASAAGRRGLAVLAAVLACAGVSLAAGPAVQAAASHHGATVPAASTPNTQLNDVSAISSTDAWAVGDTFNVSTDSTQSFIARWNGTHWKPVSTPPSSSSATVLNSVKAISATDAWAVGYYYDTNNNFAPYILHWDGTSWTQVSSPNPGTSGTYLAGVTAVSAADAWAVGYYINSSGTQQTLALHWDGTSWTQVTSPNPTGFGINVSGVSADSGTDAWAVGYYISNGHEVPFTLHWDGTSWTLATTPDPGGTNDAELFGVSASSTKNAWAVGQYRTSTGGHSLVLRWNGTSWAQVSSPSPGGANGFPRLEGVSAGSAKDAWAVGNYYKIINGNNYSQTLIAHWNGRSWTRVSSPDPSAAPFLFGVSADSANDAWAAGYYSNPNPLNGQQGLLLHWNGSSWRKATNP